MPRFVYGHVRGRPSMVVFDDVMATVQTTPHRALDGDGSRRTSFSHPDHRESVILTQIIRLVGHMELGDLAPHMRTDRLTGVHRLQSGLKNRVQVLSQLLSTFHGVPS